jgi:NitT/TauT family transport system ATP-binding protein
MLAIKHLSATYQSAAGKLKVLENIQLTVKPGEIVVLLGTSGCGKSTLLNIIGGILPTYEGEVCFNQAPLDVKKTAIGYVPQHYGLLPWQTVWQNCLLPYRIKKQKIGDTEKAHLTGQLESLGIAHLKNRYPITLSGGQRQRVALGRAFALPPDLLLLDEAFGALDALTKDEAIRTFLTLWETHRPMALIVTHNIEEALYLGHRIAVMAPSPGRITDIVENPWMGQAGAYLQPAYQYMAEQLKAALKKGSERV